MSEEQAEEVVEEVIGEVVGKAAGKAVEDVAEDVVEDKKEFDYDENQEKQARDTGWVPIEKWEGKPEDWIKADVYNVRRGLVGEIRRQKQINAGFEDRLNNVNQIHAGQLEVQRIELMAARDAAILEGGEEGLEIAKNKQYQIDTLNSAPQMLAPQMQSLPLELTEWNERNPWISIPGAKSTYAQTLFAQSCNQGNNVAQAIALVDREISSGSPAGKRTKPPMSEQEGGSRPRGYKKSELKLTMGDITQQEQRMIDAMPNAWAGKTETQILKAVADARKG